MANKARGEVSLVVGDRTYTLRPTLTAYCALEELSGKTHAEVIADAGNGSAIAIRNLLWSYLQSKHGDEIDTVEKAALLVDEAGLDVAGEQLAKLQEVNLPDESDESGGAKRPRKARAA